MATPVLTHTTLHLTPAEVWKWQKDGKRYFPEAYDADGFIHCTNDEAKLVEVANLFYRGDARPFYVLSVDLGINDEKTIYEDPDSAFPHIYGPIHTHAVTKARHVLRAEDGEFLGFGDPI